MILQIFFTLMAIAGLFAFTSGLTGERMFIIPAAVIFLLTGFILAGGTEIETQQGINKTYESVNGSYEVTEERAYYQPVQFTIGSVSFSDGLGITLVMIALWSFVAGIKGRKFRSIIKNR